MKRRALLFVAVFFGCAAGAALLSHTYLAVLVFGGIALMAASLAERIEQL